MEPNLLIRREERVARLVLNRPERKNALDRELVLALGDALEEAASESDVRVIVLSGAGGAFCSGADLRAMTDLEPSELATRLEEFHRLIRAIAGAPQPVIAAVEGAAVGFGADLALACDLRIFAESGYLEESFVKIGLMPDGGGTMWLPKLLGAGRAFEMLTLGTRLDARQCEQWGVANRVVGSAELDSSAMEWARELGRQAPLSVQSIKRSLRAAQSEELDRALDREKAGQLELLRSADFAEGVQAFLDKRAPEFRGQ